MKTFCINGEKYNQEQLLEWCIQTITDPVKEEWEKDIADFIILWFDDNLSISVMSSGTTGVSKSMVVNKTSMLASAKITNSFFKLDNSSVALLCIPAKYIGGKMMIVRALISGMNLWITKPVANVLANRPHLALDFCPMIPLQVQESIEKYPESFGKIKNVIIGGAHVSFELENKLKAFENNIYATFGMTETLSHVALRQIIDGASSDYYFALKGITFKLSNHSESQNCLIINAPHLHTDPFHTNDIVDLIDNRHFKWKGRKDNIINSGGIKFSPEELEKLLNPFITDHQFFLAGIADNKLGQKIVLFIETDDNNYPSIAHFREFEKASPKYGAPKQVVKLPLFLKTATGKLKRKEMVKTWLDESFLARKLGDHLNSD